MEVKEGMVVTVRIWPEICCIDLIEHAAEENRVISIPYSRIDYHELTFIIEPERGSSKYNYISLSKTSDIETWIVNFVS